MVCINQNLFSLPKSNYPINGFEGLTPKAMHELLYAPYDETKSPMVLNRNIDTQSINQVRFYNDIILYKVT